MVIRYWVLIVCLVVMFPFSSWGQTIQGEVRSAADGDLLIGAGVQLKGSSEGTMTDIDGRFELRYTGSYPVVLEVSYLGFVPSDVTVASPGQRLRITLEEETMMLEDVVVRGQRISDKQKASPLTVESLDLLAIKAAATDNFYDGLGALKGVDLTAASLGFKIINTRGFNSTSPVRSLQIIDGVDNQAPGLNFSLGNFLGASDLDVLKVDIIAGASSAYYGPNAFNGVISMETKDPFLHKGLSLQTKFGERSLFEVAMRWADAFSNKAGQEVFGYKLNMFYLRAYDWEADNYDPVYGTRTGKDNPGRYDAVNIYGDEYYPALDLSGAAPWNYPGFGVAHRTGYRETDLVDYNTRNIKAGASFYLRTRPADGIQSPELILASSFGSGTTVYQGDNRFSLRNILFFQNRLEFRKRDKYFIRVYATNEDAGDSFDPYFTALRLQDEAKSPNGWAQDYARYWSSSIKARANAAGYPQLVFNPETGGFDFDRMAAAQWLDLYRDSLFAWHGLAEQFANMADPVNATTSDFLVPGTPAFQEAFNRITRAKSNSGERGTRFYDKSALYHAHAEYKMDPGFLDEWTVGGNARLYRPNSDGTIFIDSAGTRISNFEFGAYTGVKKAFFNQRLTASVVVRVDKNQNFDWIGTPAASLVWQLDDVSFLRGSFSSALRNPTLADQYLHLNVGRAILVGNLEGRDSLITVPSLERYFSTLNSADLEYFSVAPVRPERVRTFELGYRTTLFDKLYLDAGYYYSLYDDFLGYNIGVTARFAQTGLPLELQPYRISANSLNQVTTQGFSLGLNYYFRKYYMLQGNYSWNRLNKTFEDDPIIPAFNTPEHKFNIGISGRDVPLRIGGMRIENIGFNINYKWIQGFLFEGSPQFTGWIPTYDLLDAQINYLVRPWNTTFKVGASNVLNKKRFQTYGGPRIGRMAYISVLFQVNHKK